MAPRKRNPIATKGSTMPESPNTELDSQAGTSARGKRTRSSRSIPANEPDFVDSDGAEEIEEDDEDEFDEEAERPSKRMKPSTNQGVKSKGKGPARRTFSLSLFPTMPMDILYEIILRLKPEDLISLSRVSKAFRDLLMSNKSKVLWKLVLDAADCPECPSSWSEPEYAMLLFGEPICELCGTGKVHHVTFGLGRRICGPCLKSRLISAKQFHSRHPSVDYYILDLLPYTYRRGQRLYLKPDIHAMADRFDNLKATESASTVGNFIATCAARSIGMQAIVKDLEEWVVSREVQKRLDTATRMEQRWEEIQHRLRSLGHVQADIDHLRDDATVKRDAPITDSNWARIRKSLDSLATEQKHIRIAASRNLMLEAAYADFQLEVRPMRWKMLPRLSELMTIPSVEEVLNRDINDHVDKATFASLNFDEIGSEWIESRKEMLSRAIQDGPRYQDVVRKVATVPLNSPAVVFRCHTFGCKTSTTATGLACREETHLSLFSALCHRCSPLTSSRHTQRGLKLSLSPAGCKVAFRLLELLELDPATTTTDDLDRLDPRFICTSCPVHQGGHNNSRYEILRVFSWRESIFHISDHYYSAPCFRLLSSQEQQLVEEQPNEYPIWLCNHCHSPDGSLFTYEEVSGHLKAKHSINNPIERLDYFCDPNISYRHPLQRNVCIPVDPPSRPLGESRA